MTSEAWLPFPVSANNLFSQTALGRRFPSKRYVAWRKHADMLLMAARLKPCSAPCLIEIELTPPTKARRDADNYVKPILDSLVRMRVIPDDDRSIVREVRARWVDGKAPGAVVRISAATVQQHAA